MTLEKFGYALSLISLLLIAQSTFAMSARQRCLLDGLVSAPPAATAESIRIACNAKNAPTTITATSVSNMLGETIRRALCLHRFQVYGNESVVIPNAEKSFLDKRTEESLRVYIYGHLGEKMAISTLSELAGMSTNAFLVAFGRTFAQTPAQYVIAQRLRRVK